MAIKFLSGQTITGDITLSGNITAATFNNFAINSTGTNNVANQIVRTEGNGYANFGWINSISGNHTGSITRITASNDAYLRYVTPAQFRTGVTDGFYAPVSTVSGVTSISHGNGITATPNPIISTGTLTMSGSYTGTFTATSLAATSATFSGTITSGGTIYSTLDSTFSTAGSISKNSVVGLIIRGVTGSVFDLALYGAGGTALMTNPAGTNNIVFNSGNVTVAGTVQVEGSNVTVINASDPALTVSDTDTNYRGSMRWLSSSNVLEFFTRYAGTYYTNNLVLDRGKVGIGTTSPSTYGDGEADDLVVGDATATANGITIASATSGTGSIMFSDGTSGVNRYRGSLIYDHGNRFGYGADTMFFRTLSTPKMTILSGGNVGIGTTSPVGTLSVRNTTAGENVLRAEGVAGSLFIDHAGAGNNLYDAANHKFRSFTGVERMRIDSFGYISTPADKRISVGAWDNSGLTSGAAFGFSVQSTSPGLFLKETDQTNRKGFLAMLGGGMYIGGSVDFFAIDVANGNRALTINNSLNVGIGTTTPSYKLDVVGNARFSGFLEMVTGGAVYQGSKFYLDGGGDTFLESPSSNIMTFTTNGTQRMRILANGNVIIGTETSTSCTLKVSSTKNGSESDPHFCITGNGYTALHFLNTTAYYIVQNSVGRSIRIVSNTNGVKLDPGATAWTSNSDIALKENIKPLENVLDKIKDYRCVEYNLKNAPEDKKIGFIAQDWVDDFPVIINKDEKDMLGMKYTETIPVLLKAIQEQQKQIEDLQAQIKNISNTN